MKLSLRALLLIAIPFSSVARESLIQNDFEAEDALAEWHSFRSDTAPKVFREMGRLRGERSNDGGLTALSRTFPKVEKRVAIEFSFAFSQGRGRVFHLWSQEPSGKDASQLNLCVQGGALQQFDGRTRSWEIVSRNLRPSVDPANPIWHRVRAVIDSESGGVDIWLSKPGELTLLNDPTATLASYRTHLPIGGISFVSGTRIAQEAWYQVDDLAVASGMDLSAPGDPPQLPEPFTLWSGDSIPENPEEIPFVENVEHRTIHRPEGEDYKFLHGAAIFEHDGVFYANWANSPINENGPHETLRGKRSFDEGKTWSELEIIGPGFEGEDRHSHGVLFEHEDEVWTIAARFGIGDTGKKFKGLKGEAFVLNPKTDQWDSRGIVMHDCWPYDQPVRMGNGDFITGGQDKDGLPVVAISDGSNFLKWESIKIPYHKKLAPSFAETTVWAEDNKVMAIIRGGGGVAWVATSSDYGRTWDEAQPGNLPMPRGKAYLGKLSSGQLYLVSNFKNRDTLCVSVGNPGESTLNQMFRIRHGKSEAPRFEGFAKSKQWSYPYGFEYDGKLFVVYSVGKEECALSVIPVSSLAPQ